MNIRKMSLKQLNELSAKIEARKQRMQREQAGTVRKQIMDTLRAAGLSVSDVFGAGGASAAAPKTGRRPGRPPKAAAPAAAPAVTAAPAKAGAKKAAKPAKKTAVKAKRGRRPMKVKKGEKPGTRAQKGVTYANPSDSKQRWSGYGKRPGWFLSAISSGKSESDLRAK